MTSTIEKVKQYCTSHEIPMEDLSVYTFQRNYSTTFASIVIDWNAENIMPNYPAEFLDSYDEKNIGDINVCYKTGLQPIEKEDGPYRDKLFPCCDGMTPFKARQLNNERYFTAFKDGSGHYPAIVYEVKRQIDKGSLLDTRHYQMINGVRTEVSGNFTQKIHSFKNYTCASCNLFFGIDLYRATVSEGHNAHHMRLNPYTANVETVHELLE